MSTHTPGPWEAFDDEIVARNTDAHVADVRLCDDTNPTEWQANMRLIAAAPDLLAALKDVQSQCAGHADEFSRRVWAIAEAAIAKAEGRTKVQAA